MTIKNAFCTITNTFKSGVLLGEYVRFLHTVVKPAKTLSLNFYFEVKISVSTCARGTNVTTTCLVLPEHPILFIWN